MSRIRWLPKLYITRFYHHKKAQPQFLQNLRNDPRPRRSPRIPRRPSRRPKTHGISGKEGGIILKKFCFGEKLMRQRRRPMRHSIRQRQPMRRRRRHLRRPMRRHRRHSRRQRRRPIIHQRLGQTMWFLRETAPPMCSMVWEKWLCDKCSQEALRRSPESST